MAKDTNNESVTVDELLMAQMIRLDAVIQLLIEKELISEDEFYTKLQQIQTEYQNIQSS